jgi:hypothetical protein
MPGVSQGQPGRSCEDQPRPVPPTTTTTVMVVVVVVVVE